MGLAASAASIVAMAGDEVRIARAGFLNIHNCWVVAMGNRYDLMDMAERLAPFDQAMADIYAARTGTSQDTMQQLMNADSWIAGS
ncbi:ATP-dependent Clp protease proteolytic subunit, partial [Staphylococcus aureus]|nr:ATP-dependent Clp protease proteolytic subunit [Staphylococcus aureus]